MRLIKENHEEGMKVCNTMDACMEYACLNVCIMYVCMYVCMYFVFMYECMYVCMYVVCMDVPVNVRMDAYLDYRGPHVT
jgi:hypothetical protein